MTDGQRDAYELESAEDYKYRVTVELVVDSGGFELDVPDLISTLESAISYQGVRVEIADSVETTWPDLTEVRVLVGGSPRPMKAAGVRDESAARVV
ncbi:hypothetical protein ACIBG8_54615 [Nonomuraea sp. NPDC050556]|uniref:hypothetical protein n=1 Tax=Nonomuraea sp. NPDC050556 TaxID=3364369 RepID=UPI00379A22FC